MKYHLSAGQIRVFGNSWSKSDFFFLFLFWMSSAWIHCRFLESRINFAWCDLIRMFGVKLVSEILFVHFRACSIFSMFCDNSKISGGKAPVLQREKECSICIFQTKELRPNAQLHKLRVFLNLEGYFFIISVLLELLFLD